MAGLSLGNELSMGQVRRSEFEGTQPNTSVEDEIGRSVASTLAVMKVVYRDLAQVTGVCWPS